MKPLLSARSLSRTLAGEVPVKLVKEATLDVHAGEFVSITGPSGSGKSSLLYLLGLLDRPTSGEVLVLGQLTTNLNDNDLAGLRLEKLGFIFQFHFLLPEFTALENVMIPMRRLGALGESSMKEKARALLASLGLDDQGHKLPKQLSGGQQQRVAIARALANDPVVILADEPTGNLDTGSSQNVQDILKNLAHAPGRAVVAVTHDMDFAARADRRIHIVDGRIEGSH